MTILWDEITQIIRQRNENRKHKLSTAAAMASLTGSVNSSASHHEDVDDEMQKSWMDEVAYGQKRRHMDMQERKLEMEKIIRSGGSREQMLFKLNEAMSHAGVPWPSAEGIFC